MTIYKLTMFNMMYSLYIYMIVDIIYIYTPLRNNDCIHAYIHIILLCDYTVLHPHVLMVLSPAILMAPDGVKGSPAIPVGKAQCTLVDPGNTCESGIFHLFRAGKSTVHGQKTEHHRTFFRRVIDFISSFDQQRVRKTP